MRQDSPPRAFESPPAAPASTPAADPPAAADPPDAAADPSPALPDDTVIDWSANSVMKTLGHISSTMTRTEYVRAEPRVNERRGIYAFDCSGMVEWVLRKATPAAAKHTRDGLGHRPLARDFYNRVASVSSGPERRGWLRIDRVDEAEPGDVIAWIKPPVVASPNTGHVAFIVLKPVRVPGRDNAFLVRIADASHLLHDADTRGEGRGGFGLGTIVILTDPAGGPSGYGWAGLRAWTFETAIAIGRPVR
jgi:hypothetical protein